MLAQTPKLYFGASAVGIYGHRGNEILETTSAIGSGFLADVTEAWEKEHASLANLVERNIILRIGIVLSKKGGALKEILKTAPLGVYGYFGNGKAYYPWIHIDDICKIIIDSFNDTNLSGVYNGTAPNPVTIKELVTAAKNANSGMGVLMPVPKFGLKIAMGEMADMLFNSTRAIPSRLQKAGFKFLFEDIDLAMKSLLGKT